MSNENDRLVFTVETWRTFFTGKQHCLLSTALAEAFASILGFCVKENLIADPVDLVKKLSTLDNNDLSDTTKLLATRFETNSMNSIGKSKYLNLAQCLSDAVYSRSPDHWKSDVKTAKSLMQKSNELENISRALKYARNVNAHTHTEILDFGFILSVYASIARLFELFDFENIKIEDVNRIRNVIDDDICEIVHNIQLGKTIVPKKEIINVIKEKDTSIQFQVEMEPDELDEQKNELRPTQLSNDPELPYETIIHSRELERQALIRIRSEIFTYFEENNILFDTKNCFLSGSSLKDILLYRPKSIDQIMNVFSVEMIFKRDQNLADIQVKVFGKKIVEVF